MGTTIHIPYGKSILSFQIPEHVTGKIVDCRDAEPASNVEEVISKALDNPIDSLRIEQIVNPEQRICIICDDISRPTPVKSILSILLPRLAEAGVKRENIFIVMALGSHRYMTKEEMIEKVGIDVFHHYSVYNSEFKDGDNLIDLGMTNNNAHIRITKKVMESDIRIGIGNIVPHPAMGWSGGGKILYPGVASEDTVEQFHILQGLADKVMFGMDNCPIRLEVEQWVDTVGLHFIINTILTPDLSLYKVVTGNYVSAHRKGVEYAKEICGAPIQQKADVAIVSSFPVDIDYWQATKGFLCGARAVKDGGTIILLTPCFEGVGPHEKYVEYIGNDDSESLLLSAQKGEIQPEDLLALSVGTCVMKVRKRFKLITVSNGLSAEQMNQAKIDYYPVERINDALKNACSHYSNPLLYVIPHGGEAVPFFPN